MKYLSMALLLSAAGTAICPAQIYTSTGFDPSSLVTFSENTLLVSGGTILPTADGQAALTYDSSNGRLFGIFASSFVEFDRTTRAVVNQHAFPESDNLMGLAAFNGTLYSYTGTSSPALVKINENTLVQTGGVAQPNTFGFSSLAVDSTNGRLFVNTTTHLIEFDPNTLAILNQQPLPGGNSSVMGIAAHNGVIYSYAGFESPGVVTISENTLLQTGGTVQGSVDALASLTINPETGRLFAISALYMLEFDPETLAITNQQSMPDPVGAIGIATIPEPSAGLLGLLAFGLAATLRPRRARIS